MSDPKVRVTVRPQRSYERVIEFSAVIPGNEYTSQRELAGGLIAFQVTREGKLKVELYNLDPNVVVVAPNARAAYIPSEHA